MCDLINGMHAHCNIYHDDCCLSKVIFILGISQGIIGYEIGLNGPFTLAQVALPPNSTIFPNFAFLEH